MSFHLFLRDPLRRKERAAVVSLCSCFSWCGGFIASGVDRGWGLRYVSGSYVGSGGVWCVGLKGPDGRKGCRFRFAAALA